MEVFGRSKLSEFVADRVVYRNLVPCDERLPGLDDLRDELDLPENVIPRKSEKNYARAVALLLRKARKLDLKNGQITRLLFIGDTRLLDGTAFENICTAGGWPGMAFIGSENDSEPRVEIVPTQGGQKLYLSNRWSIIEEFSRFCKDEGFVIDEGTAVIIDIDKTAIGGRGRNSQVIDQARVRAVEVTVAELLGEDFDVQSFKEAYGLLNQPEFHPFTTDNQDYLAYVCLILGSGLSELDELVAQIRSGDLKTFNQYIHDVNHKRTQLHGGLVEIHDEVYANVAAGDPTPFKVFRRNEYLETINRMGQLDDEAHIEQMLSNEILITHEVRREALKWSKVGALLFSLSDKPDEASLPTEQQAAQGFQPIHRKETHVVGERNRAVQHTGTQLIL